MSQQAVETTIGKLSTDEAFRQAFFADPEAASLRAGLKLTACELRALRAIPPAALARFSEALDDRICRLAVDLAREESRR